MTEKDKEVNKSIGKNAEFSMNIGKKVSENLINSIERNRLEIEAWEKINTELNEYKESIEKQGDEFKKAKTNLDLANDLTKVFLKHVFIYAREGNTEIFMIYKGHTWKLDTKLKKIIADLLKLCLRTANTYNIKEVLNFILMNITISEDILNILKNYILTKDFEIYNIYEGRVLKRTYKNAKFFYDLFRDHLIHNETITKKLDLLKGYIEDGQIQEDQDLKGHIDMDELWETLMGNLPFSYRAQKIPTSDNLTGFLEKIKEDFVKTDEWKELLNKLTTNNKIENKEIAYYVGKGLSKVIDFVEVRYTSPGGAVDDEYMELFYFDGKRLKGDTKDLINKIITNVLSAYVKPTSFLISEIIRTIKGLTFKIVEKHELNPKKYLPLQNVVLDLETLNPISYKSLSDKGIYFTNILDVDLDFDLLQRIKNGEIEPSEISPSFHRFLKRFYEGENYEKLVLTLGEILLPYRSKTHFVFVVGPPDTGKTTLHGILVEVLGKGMVSTSSIKQLMGRFGDASLEGKRVNLSDEREKSSIIIEAIKKRTGGGWSTIEEKHKPPRLAYIGPTFINFVNEGKVPRFDEYDETLEGRIVLIYTSNPLDKKEKNKGFRDEMIKNKKGILHYLIWCQKRLRDNDWEIPQDEEELRAVIFKSMSNVKEFVDECLRKDPNTRIKGKDLYDLYTIWATRNNLKPEGRNTFYSNLIGFGDGVRRKEIQRHIYFEGVSIKEDCEYLANLEVQEKIEEKIENYANFGEGDYILKRGMQLNGVFHRKGSYLRKGDLPEDKIKDLLKNGFLEEIGEGEGNG